MKIAKNSRYEYGCKNNTRGWRRYKDMRKMMEEVLEKSRKKGIPTNTAMYGILDVVIEEYKDSEITKLIERVKDRL